MTNKEIIDYLAACSPADLADILAESIYRRPVEVRNGIEERMVLCTAWRVLQPLESDVVNSWSFSVIAAPASIEQWQASRGQGYWESRDCPTCKVEVSSYAKRATCPLCSSELGLT